MKRSFTIPQVRQDATPNGNPSLHEMTTAEVSPAVSIAIRLADQIYANHEDARLYRTEAVKLIREAIIADRIANAHASTLNA